MTRIGNSVTIGLLFAVSACSRESKDDPRAAGKSPAAVFSAESRATPAPSAEAVASSQGVARTALNDRRAHAEFTSIKGVGLHGDAKLEETASGVLIHVNVAGAPPGTKGIHIHEKGDCADIAGNSMGSHFNPGKVAHGLPGSSQHHPGDLGNIAIGQDGTGKLEITTDQGGLEAGQATSFLGRAIVIHEADDKGVQPTGGAGKPIACAVIQAG